MTHWLALEETNNGSGHLLAAASSPRSCLLEQGLRSSLDPGCAAEGPTGSGVPD